MSDAEGLFLVFGAGCVIFPVIALCADAIQRNWRRTHDLRGSLLGLWRRRSLPLPSPSFLAHSRR